MNTTTLRGVFPEPKPAYKRNFIKENMKYIKQLQGLLPPETDSGENKSVLDNKLKPKVLNLTRQNAFSKSQHNLSKVPSQSQTNAKAQKSERRKIEATVPVLKLNLEKGKVDALNIKPHLPLPSTEKYLHRGVQTDNPEEIQRLFKNGVIRYPSPSVVNALTGRKVKNHMINQDRGDIGAMQSPTEELSENMRSLDVNEKNYIKENILALKNKIGRSDKDELKSPVLQKGTIPKYIRDRKEELNKQTENEPDCPDGHVLLPDEERKETLRVLRQSYADRIQELNSMPVRSDTLRMRKRKMELEEELKKIDEGIKVFQRPRVFVKINA